MKKRTLARSFALVLCSWVGFLNFGCSETDYFKLRAHLGGADSQILLGHAYETGKGVDQDPQEAMRWYRRAAAQDHPKAFGLMGRLYAVGFGVERDLIKANMYFQLGYRRGEQHLGGFIALVERELEEREIQRSQRLADAWDSKH